VAGTASKPVRGAARNTRRAGAPVQRARAGCENPERAPLFGRRRAAYGRPMADSPHLCARCHLAIGADEAFVRAEPYDRTFVADGHGEQPVYVPGALVHFHVACAPSRDQRYRILA